jgi:hypothetical protein
MRVKRKENEEQGKKIVRLRQGRGMTARVRCTHFCRICLTNKMEVSLLTNSAPVFKEAMHVLSEKKFVVTDRFVGRIT